MIRAEVDIAAFKANNQDMVDFAEKDAIPIAARVQIKQIRDYSALGLDPSGASYAPYTKAYGKRRVAAGFSLSPVNLRLTGGLMASLQRVGNVVTVSDEAVSRVNLETMKSANTTYAQIVQGLQRKRKIFGVNPATLEEMAHDIADALSLGPNRSAPSGFIGANS